MTTFLITALVTMLMLGLVSVCVQQAHKSPHQGNMLSLLPGDIKYESPNSKFRFYFPITTSIVISIVLTLVLRFLS